MGLNGLNKLAKLYMGPHSSIYHFYIGLFSEVKITGYQMHYRTLHVSTCNVPVMHLISGHSDLKCITGTLHVSTCKVPVMHLISGDSDLKCIAATLNVSTCNVPVMQSPDIKCITGTLHVLTCNVL